MGKYNICVTINGKVQKVKVEAGETLAQMLRNDLHLTGGKVSCDKGDCGACTVIVNGKAVKSCIYPAVRADGAEILTIRDLEKRNCTHYRRDSLSWQQFNVVIVHLDLLWQQKHY